MRPSQGMVIRSTLIGRGGRVPVCPMAWAVGCRLWAVDCGNAGRFHSLGCGDSQQVKGDWLWRQTCDSPAVVDAAESFASWRLLRAACCARPLLGLCCRTELIQAATRYGFQFFHKRLFHTRLSRRESLACEAERWCRHRDHGNGGNLRPGQ